MTVSAENPYPSGFSSFWRLDPNVTFLNHGSFGACPGVILDKQTEYRNRLESQPVRFFIREMRDIFDNSRHTVARFANSRPEDLVFVQNASSGVNTVLRSLKFNPGDEILHTSHIYGACRRLLEYVAGETGAILVEAGYDFPVASPEVIVQSIVAKVTPRTRIALVDHISSATALIHPVEAIVRELDKRGVDTIIDGAHALGNIPLDLDGIGAAYYISNCHKWLCSPKSAAILHVRRDRQDGIVPVVISHAGHEAMPFDERFFWPGTIDPTAALCVADAIEYMASLMPGGWPAIMKRNRELCLEARTMICKMLDISTPCPDEMIASMATIPLKGTSLAYPFGYMGFHPVQETLMQEYHIEIPVWNWLSPPSTLIRISVQLYNSLDQYNYLGFALMDSHKNMKNISRRRTTV